MMEAIEVGLYVFFEALSVVFCLHYLYGEKLHLDMITICFVLMDVVWMSVGHINHFSLSWSLVMYPIVWGYCALKFGYNVKAIIVNNVLYIAILSSIQATIMIVFSIVFKVDKMKSLDNLIINIIMLCFVVTILRKCKLRKLSEILQSSEKIIKISLLVMVVSTFLFIVGYKQNRSFEILYYVMLGVSITLIIVATIDIGKHKLNAREAKAELRLHKLYEASFRELIDEICARQHEFDNHINTIYSQHRLYKTYDELVEAQRKYCDAVINENHYNKLLSKGNPVILCFLYSQFTEMEKKGITFIYEINIDDLECGMPIHKIVELLGNLIKNAVEAVENRGKGKIRVVMLEKADRVQIEVLNESEVIDETKIKEFFKRGYSEKGNKRGYGLYNVAKICEEYGAAIICKNENIYDQNWLVFRLLMNKPL